MVISQGNMSELKKVKLQTIVENQIPQFLIEESPLFSDFLKQYYISQEYPTGIVDLITNLDEYKNFNFYNEETFYTEKNPCILEEDIYFFSDTIKVNNTIGFPDSYGLLKINDEIITYTGITTNSFTGCIRGFSGLSKIEDSQTLTFENTISKDHPSSSIVRNLSAEFFKILFNKIKKEFLPGFEDRDFSDKINVRNVLLKMRDFYLSKGTDSSFQILFDILYAESVNVIKPQEYTISPSNDNYLVTKNILVEQIIKDTNTKVLTTDLVDQLKGKTLFQKVYSNSTENTASAAIFNIEIRYIDEEYYYEISLDKESFILDFEVANKTRVIENVPENSSVIFVDSTVGFAKSGSFLVKTDSFDYPINLSYEDKSLNQFIGVSNIIDTISYGSKIIEDNFLYTYLDDGTKIEFRLINIISNVDTSTTSNLRVNDKISLSSFGLNLNSNIFLNKWIYNLPIIHNIKSITNGTIKLKNELAIRSFYVDDIVKLVSSDEDSSIEIKITNVVLDSPTGSYLEFNPLPNFSYSIYDKLEKKIKKGSSIRTYYNEIGNIPTGIQNTYVDYDMNNFYVSSSGLCNNKVFSENQKKSPVGISTGILNIQNHGYYTGEKIYYYSSDESKFNSGTYFVNKIDDNNINLVFNQNDLLEKKYIPILPLSNDYVVPFGFQNTSTNSIKKLQNQKLLKKFPIVKPLFEEKKADRSISNKKIGILLDGQEIYSTYLFDENIYYGKIDSIILESKGKNYDVINFSNIIVSDLYGSGCIAHANVTGSVDSIKILSPGVGYQQKPKITIEGGNGYGAILESNLVKTNIVSNFKGDIKGVNISPTNSINFLTNHNFQNGEEVVYKTNYNTEIPPFKNNSIYFIGIVNNTEAKFYNSKKDALTSTNPIVITGISSGVHSFQSLKTKNTITKIYVKDPGKNYSNKLVKIPSVLSLDNKNNGINYFDNYIFARSHNFNTGDLVIYSCSETPISGLVTSNYYYVTTLDENRFKLSYSGTETNLSKDNFNNKKYVNISSLGSGYHTFSYPPIQIKVESLGLPEISTPILKPIVLGEVESVFVIDGGVKYGSPNILNFHRRPKVSIGITNINLDDAFKSIPVLKPIVINGSINSVQILNKGNGYGNDTLIKVFGNGKYAELEPVISNGKIVDVIILNPGVGYDDTTTLSVEKFGSGAKFIANVFKWKINQVEKNKTRINSSDESIIASNQNDDLGLSLVSFYPTKNLRLTLSDNITSEKKEDISRPNVILGWAYDGNPIFGPYTKIGNEIVRVKSSYQLSSSPQNINLRPNFPNGFFHQDYIFDKKSTEGNLDQHNGMFINDKNLPGINYGYFMTIDEKIFSTPVYPYVIGQAFKSNPIQENYNSNFNQDNNLENLNLIRNVGPYFTQSSESKYEVLNRVDEKYKQDFIVKDVFPSGITSIRIYNSGSNYKVGDYVIFDNFSSEGFSASAEVSKIHGKELESFSIAKTNFKGVTFASSELGTIGITSIPHGFSNGETITVKNISSNNYSQLEGKHKIYVRNKITGLSQDIKPTSITGNWTSIIVNDISGFKVDDYIGINTEILKITNISESESKLFVSRPVSISNTHYSSSSSVVLLPNSFEFSNKNDIPQNVSTYFNPEDSLGISDDGTTYYKELVIYENSGKLNGGNRSFIGIETALIKVGDYVYGQYISSGTTVVSVGINSVQIDPITTFTAGITTSKISFKRIVYDKFVPAKAIYIKDHNYFTGQELIYNVGIGGTGLNVYDGTNYFTLNDNQKIYALNLGKDLIGISTTPFKISTGLDNDYEILTFENPKTGIGNAHVLKTNYNTLQGSIESYFISATTTENHQLLNDDRVKFNIDLGLPKEEIIRFDQNLRKITTELIYFDSQNDINLNSSEIIIENNNLSTGDKIVYYSNGNSTIGGLTNNSTYFVLKEKYNSIKLCENYSDIKIRNYKILTNTGVGTHSISLINPPLTISKGGILKLTLDDTLINNDKSLNFELKIYKDNQFKEEIEEFSYSGIGTYEKMINTLEYDYPNDLYYNIVQIDKVGTINYSIYTPLESDEEVRSNNKIKIIDSEFKIDYPVILVSNDSFKVNLNKEPESLINISSSENTSLLKNVSYVTSSKNSTGAISNFKINYGGINYKKIPKISGVYSSTGSGALVKAESSKIGKIKLLDKVKEGFDFPSDYTLRPFLSSPTISQIKDIQRIDRIGITTGGNGYLTPPSLKVLDGNVVFDKIKLSCKLDGSSVSEVIVEENVNNLAYPLKIIPTRNSNGFEIDYIEVDGTIVTLELINNDSVFYPLITSSANTENVVFPFSVGDKIFIENCRKSDFNQKTDSFNSKDYNYNFFTVTSVDENNYRITYDMSEFKTNFNGNLDTGEANYSTDNGYGFVVNQKNMPKFEMILIDDLSYVSSEVVSSNTFVATVMDNGWDNEINQLRMNNSSGILNVGDKLKGSKSLLNGTVESVISYNLKSDLDYSREKVNIIKPEYGLLNDFYQRISDNNYYQKFSYSLRSKVPYSDWKEPVLSLVHPSGYKSFSDLSIISKSSSNLKVKISDNSLKLVINLDNYASMYERNNFSLVYEDDNNYFDNSIERITIGSETANISGVGVTGPILGVALKPYIINKSNKVLDIDDISGQFDGSNSFVNLGERIIQLDSTEPYYVGISTIDLQVGDFIGLSTYLSPNTYIVNILQNKIQINNPHKFNYGTLNDRDAVVDTIVDDTFSYPKYSMDSNIHSFDFSGLTFDAS